MEGGASWGVLISLPQCVAVIQDSRQNEAWPSAVQNPHSLQTGM